MSLRLLSLAVLPVLISACGGGGGGSSSPSPTPPPGNQNTAPTLSPLSDVAVVEGEVAVVAVSASDSDGDTLTYALTGSDAALFTLDASNNVSFAQAPDFERPSDANADNAYELTVRVNDPSNASDSASFTVSVTDALDGRVVDGPIRGAQVELSATNAQSAQIVTTDADGYFNFGDVLTVSGQRITVSGGTDTFTDSALTDTVFIGSVGDGSQIAQVNAITTVLAAASSGETTRVLSALSIALTPSEVARADIWRLAESGDEAAEQAQRVNFQLAVLFSTVNSLVADAASSIDVTEAVASEVVALAVMSNEPLSLASEATLTTLISESLTVLGVSALDETVREALASALADLNTVLAEDAIEPTSNLAREVASAVQTVFQASVVTLASNSDTLAFASEASPNTLFSNIDTGVGTADTDEDGLADVLDADDDGDDVRDGDDAFPLDGAETADTDGDGVGDNADAFPTDASETQDSDNDGVGDNSDAFPNDETEVSDSDDDGVGDNSDVFPNDPTETADSDSDGVGDNADAFPNDSGETLDSDGDGVGDNADAFPDDASETADTDGDGVGDNSDAFPQDPSEVVDSDSDGVGDNADAFPNDPNETADTDGDGVGDNADAFPEDPAETVDSDSDGVGDNSDAFPNDPNETADTDGDGVGDNADAFPEDPAETVDSDSDGVGDNSDAFPNDPNETLDTDGDGVGDNADAFPEDPDETVDSDSDGVGDNSDAFPNDPNETLDTDGDGIGNNADEDDDGDGIKDADDAAPLDPNVGLVVSGQLILNPDIVLDSDTNNPNNVFERNNIVGDFSPDPASAQSLTSPFILHGYVNRPLAGSAGPLRTEGDDDDFFIVDALAGQRFILEIPDDAQDLDFYLFNESGVIVAASENPPGFVDADGFQEVLTAPSTGRYFLNVYAYSFQGFPTASNYTVTTDFKGAPGAQRYVRAGEVIVGLKASRDSSPMARARAFDDVASRHSLRPSLDSQGKFRLMRSTTKGAGVKRGSSHAKFAALASQDLRDMSEVAHMVKALVKDPAVEVAEPNYRYFRHATTNDPLLGQMWHLEQVNTSTAWDTTTGAPEVVIAVIDAGNLAQHPDFLGQTTEGYDFVSDVDNYDGDGIDADPEDATPLFDECAQDDTFYHGAHIAGTIGATGNNAEGIAGLAYTSKLMHLRVLDGDCGGSTYDVYQALLYAIGAENDSGTVPNNPADVVNMSLGGGGSSPIFQDAVNQAAAQGVIVVASSGNDGASQVSYPAAYDNTFAIGATGLTGAIASYSNQGPRLDLVAPGGGNGGGVLSLNKVKDFLGNPLLTYSTAQGTSMSAPHAAAIFALMKSVHPNLTTERLEALLASGALTDDIGDPGFDNESGWGLLKADKAVEVALADANGTFVLPARLLLSTSQLYFGGATTTAMISGTNPGETGLEVTSIDVGASWITVSERTDAALGEVGRWDISVNRAGLAPGFYSSLVTYNATDDAGNDLVSNLTVSLRVGKSSGGDLGAINVFVTDADTGATVASSVVTQADGYQYQIGLPNAGSYQITASTDTNGDSISCENGEACGRLGGLETPQTLELSGSQSDLDITVRLPVEN